MLMAVPKVNIVDWITKLSAQQYFALFLFAAIALGLLTFASEAAYSRIPNQRLKQ